MLGCPVKAALLPACLAGMGQASVVTTSSSVHQKQQENTHAAAPTFSIDWLELFTVRG